MRQVSSDDSTLSYLPLAHIFDRIVEEFALYSGACIGYYQVHLLLSVLDSLFSQSCCRAEFTLGSAS